MLLIKSDPFETEINGTLRHFVADLRALEKTLLKISESEPHIEVLQACEEAAEFLPRLQSTLREHVARLDEVIGERDAALPKPGANSLLVPAAANPEKTPVRDA